MGRFDMKKLKLVDIKYENNDDSPIYLKESFETFDESILELGDITSISKPINALVAIFDLESFTIFCNQIDPQLQVPEFLSIFLKWIFNELRESVIKEKYEYGYKTYSKLPFFCKFMGDGILFIWDTENMGAEEVCNVIVSLNFICYQYANEFVNNISEFIISPPVKLRCGVARGIVYSVGNGNDYIGACINMASRLQKMSLLSFCFSKRGVNFKGVNDFIQEMFLIKKVEIRGIGASELVGVLKEEYDNLPDEEKKMFK